MGQGDRQLDAALKRLGRVGAGRDVSGVCLSAEVLAAWTDGTLPAHQRTLAEAHVADCPRCLEVLAAMARTAPVDSAAQAAWWRAPWRVRWLVPTMAAATALVLWIYVGSTPPRETDQPTPSAVQPTSPPAAQPRSEPAAETSAARVESAASDARARDATAKRGRSVPPARTAAPGSTMKEETLGARQRAAHSVPPPNAAPVDTSAAARPVEAPAPPVPPATAQAQADRQDTEVARRPAAPESAELRLMTMVVVLSPDPSKRWRIDGTAVDGSTDGGLTWTRQFTGESPLVAGHAPASNVCWMVGRQGIVLLSRDGRTWQRVTSPAAVDLIGLTAVDARVATVSAADGRVFLTSDGGQTWSLQENEKYPF